MTRGTQTFFVAGDDGEFEQLGRVYTNSDSYPSGRGLEICKVLEKVRYKCRNVDRAILALMAENESDHFYEEQEYNYRLYFANLGENPPDITKDLRIVVFCHYLSSPDETPFDGDYEAFKSYCLSD